MNGISIPSDSNEIKQLRMDGMDDASISNYYGTLAQDISSETTLMNQLSGNTNIVNFEDSRIVPKSGGIGYDIFIRMELLESLTNKTIETPLPPDEVVKLGLDICNALTLCAKRRIIHRDIKPDNIFVSPSGDYKLGDFGIARQLEKTTTYMSKKGTYNYMAPEVYKGEKYGASCDLYSLGLVMYRLVNKGRLPFLPPAPNPITANDREIALQQRLKGEEIPAPCDADMELSSIILKACEFNAKDRFSSAEEMMEALNRYSKGEHGIVVPVAGVSGLDQTHDKIDETQSVYVGSDGSKNADGINLDATSSIYTNNVNNDAEEKTESSSGDHGTAVPVVNDSGLDHAHDKIDETQSVYGGSNGRNTADGVDLNATSSVYTNNAKNDAEEKAEDKSVKTNGAIAGSNVTADTDNGSKVQTERESESETNQNRKSRKGVIILVACIGVLLLLAGIGSAVFLQQQQTVVTDIILSSSSLSLKVGESSTLSASVYPSNATNKTVTWTSSNTSVATVNNGIVTAMSAGTVTIYAFAGGKSSSCTVNVQTATISITGVTLSSTSLSLTVGGTATLTATVSPSNATNRTVSWSSSNTNVATVNNGTVTAKSAGTATITASAGGKSASCTVTVQTTTINVAGISLNNSSLSLTVGGTATLTATVSPSNATNGTITWSSSNTNVATVNNGTVTAKAAGSATITASAGGKSASCTVNVQAATVNVTGVTLSSTNLSLTAGGTATLTATVSPSNATNRTVSWSSSNTSVATVSNGTVTAKSVGTATITATAGGKNAYCTVDVQPVTINVTSVILSNSSISLTEGETATLSATVTPSNATNRTVSWSSSNSSIASVNNGTVTAKSAGTATITASADGKSASCTVIVQPLIINVSGVSLSNSSLSLNVGSTSTLSATVTPSNATNKTVSWSSSNPSVATVNNGTVTAKSAGTATITATADGKSASCTVTVLGKYILTYDATGGSVNPSSKELTSGTAYGTLPTPTRDYYSFTGWYTSPNGGSQVSASTTMGTSSVTIYAHWELKPFSGEWSAWSSTAVSEDTYTQVETRRVYEYPVYKIYVYGENYLEFSYMMYVHASNGGASDNVIQKLYNLVKAMKSGNEDPLNVGVTYNSNPVQFLVKNTNELNKHDNSIRLISSNISVTSQYPSSSHGSTIQNNGENWVIDVYNMTSRTEYRYQRRIK